MDHFQQYGNQGSSSFHHQPRIGEYELAPLPSSYGPPMTALDTPAQDPYSLYHSFGDVSLYPMETPFDPAFHHNTASSYDMNSLDGTSL